MIVMFLLGCSRSANAAAHELFSPFCLWTQAPSDLALAVAGAADSVQSVDPCEPTLSQGWNGMSGILQELQNFDRTASDLAVHCKPEPSRQPFLSFLTAPEHGLPMVNGIEAWLTSVDGWVEAARFMSVCIDFIGIPLLTSINYTQQLFNKAPRYQHLLATALGCHLNRATSSQVCR